MQGPATVQNTLRGVALRQQALILKSL